MPEPLDERWRTRFSRQIALDQIGESGQRRLSRSHALLIGVGALGAALAETLARAGVAALTIIDRDIVDETNLHRQGLFDARDADEALPKAVAAERRLRAVAPQLRVDAHADDFTPRLARALLREGARFDVILDATDNFETRYLINDFAVASSVPLVYAGVIETHGLVLPILPRASKPGAVSPSPLGGEGSERSEPGEGSSLPSAPPLDARVETPCLRCVFPDPPDAGAIDTCETAGVLPSAVSAVAALQATEAFKILLGAFADASTALLSLDVWTSKLTRLVVRRDDACPCCAHRRFDYLEAARASTASALCGRSSVQIAPPAPARLDIPALAQRLAPLGDFRATPHALQGVLRDERADAGEPVRITIFPDGRAIIAGVADERRARAIHARCLGA